MGDNPFMKYMGVYYPEQQYNSSRKYPMNDMGSVYTHYDPKLGKNVPTKNIIKGGKTKNGTSSK